MDQGMTKKPKNSQSLKIRWDHCGGRSGYGDDFSPKQSEQWF